MNYSTEIIIKFTSTENATRFTDILNESESLISTDDFGPSSLNNIIRYLKWENILPANLNGRIEYLRQKEGVVILMVDTKVEPSFGVIYALSQAIDKTSHLYYVTTRDDNRVWTNQGIHGDSSLYLKTHTIHEEYQSILDITQLTPKQLQQLTL